MAISAHNAFRAEAGVNNDALLLCLFNFLDSCRHFITPFDAYDVHLARAQTQSGKRDVDHLVGGYGGQVLRPLFGLHFVLPHDFTCSRAGHVHGHVAAANDDNLLADGELVSQVYVQEKIDSFVHAIQIDTGNGKIAAAVGAHRNQHSIKSLRAQIFNGEILSRALVEFQRDIARLQNFPHLRFHYIARQPVLRNAPGPDDGHLPRQLSLLLYGARFEVLRFRTISCGQKALQRPNLDWFVDGPAPARGLTGMGANPPADAGHRVGIAGKTISLFKAALGDERHVAAGVGMGRTGHHAGKVGIQPIPINRFVEEPCSHGCRRRRNLRAGPRARPCSQWIIAA